MRIKFMPRNEALQILNAVDPADLLMEVLARGVRVMPPENLLNKITECPHCGIKGKVAKDFGVRVLGGTVRAQSWCRECRKNPRRMARGSKTAPKGERDMIALLQESLKKVGLKKSQLAKLAKAMGAARV